MKLFITYCSKEKNCFFKMTCQKVSPDCLYTSDRIRNFMRECKEKQVNWAIFSDRYGVWFPNVKHKWYDKSPDDVTIKEFKCLLRDFDSKLEAYDEIWFYHKCTEPLHPLYECLLRESKLSSKIKKFTDFKKIG